MYERAEFRELQDRGANERANTERFRLGVLQQAEVATRNLTGDPLWDRFLSYIQTALDVTQDQLVGFQEVLASPQVVKLEDNLAAKISVIQCKERIATLEAIIALPKDLQDAGEKARGILEQLDDIKASAPVEY